MITYTTISYNDIYDGPKPELADLLAGISSKIILGVMAMVNAELNDERDIEEVQLRLTHFICEEFPPHEAANVFKKIAEFRKKINSPASIWGKRYALEMMKYEFLNYRDINKLTNTPEESVRIFKAYLLIADMLNEKDRMELAQVRGKMEKEDPYFFEKMVWPFVLTQFDNNNRVNPISQLFRLCALLKYCITDEELLAIWKEFIRQNGFQTLRTFMGSINFLIKVAQTRNPQKQLRIFSWINAEDLPNHLLNLSFDRQTFAANPDKQVDYLGMRERPLLQTGEKEFTALDLDFLLNKVYNGPLFDLFYQTGMAEKTRFKSFADFKSHIATEVSEKIVFKGILTKMFQKKHVRIYFDDEGKEQYPDCYIRCGKKIFLIEFKDYLFPGKLIEDHSFEKIKEHIDTKFVKNQKGKNKGINQIIAQIKILMGEKFDFDPFTEKNITVYPTLVHTNFTYQMPGINDYLNKEFKKLVEENIGGGIKVKPLVLLDMDTLFEFLQVDGMDTKMLADLLDRYDHIQTNRKKHFEKFVSQDNFVRARSSFDEVYATVMDRDLKSLPVKQRTSRFLESIGMTDTLFDSF
jgi:hypothetical protein